MLTVVCVYKPGGGFEPDYVYRLRDSVADNCTIGYEFVCVTSAARDLPGVKCIPIVGARKGFWNKLEIFRPNLFDGPVVYMDLDTMILNDVTDILQYPHTFTAGQCFKHKNRDNLASWFLAFDGREGYGYLFDGYKAGTPEQYEQSWSRWGDQGYIQDNIRCPWTSIEEIAPGRTASFKIDIRRQGKVPEGTSFVCFHGKPRPHEIEWRLPNGD